MAGQETARTIAFSVRKMTVLPINVGSATGVSTNPITIDTPDTLEFKVEVMLEELRGGAYQFPLAIDPKEMKGTITGKLTDCPPTLEALLTAAPYTKSTTSGPSVDSLVNISGTSVGTRVSATITGTPSTDVFAIVANAAQQYTVYPFSTGKPATAVTTQLASTVNDTASITGVTLTTVAGSFTTGDVGNLEIVNLGASNTGETIMETDTGASTLPLILPQVAILGDATRRGKLFQFWAYYCELAGETLPYGQGRFATVDFTATVQQPPYGVTNQTPWRFRQVA